MDFEVTRINILAGMWSAKLGFRSNKKLFARILR
jgi:hypothetical protein